MKKYFLTLMTVVIIATVLFSCSEDDPYKICKERYGKLNVQFSDSLTIDFDRVILENLLDSSSSIDIFALYHTDDCLLRTTVRFFKLKKELSVQPLVWYDWGNEIEAGSTRLQTYDNADALTERFLLYEGEPHWLQFTELGNEKVKGRFQATYVFKGNNKYWNLPDTLRFNNVEFEAVIYTGPFFTY